MSCIEWAAGCKPVSRYVMCGWREWGGWPGGGGGDLVHHCYHAQCVTSVTRHMLLLSVLSSTPHRGNTLSHVAVGRTEDQSTWFHSLIFCNCMWELVGVLEPHVMDHHRQHTTNRKYSNGSTKSQVHKLPVILVFGWWLLWNHKFWPDL